MSGYPCYSAGKRTVKGVLKTQAENTNAAAKKFMKENEKLRRLLKSYNKEEEYILEAENKKLVKDQEKLKSELKKTSDALSKAQNDVVTMKMQSERLSKEYDRLLQEHFGASGSFMERQQERPVNCVKEGCDTYTMSRC